MVLRTDSFSISCSFGGKKRKLFWRDAISPIKADVSNKFIQIKLYGSNTTVLNNLALNIKYKHGFGLVLINQPMTFGQKDNLKQSMHRVSLVFLDLFHTPL
jgi:hypothetical protein